MKLDNSELKLIVDLFCEMRKTVKIIIHGRMFFDLLSSGEHRKISIENNRFILNINKGSMVVVDEDDIILTLTNIDKELMKTNLRDFLWCNCVEFNNIVIEGYPEIKSEFIDCLLKEYLGFRKCKCLDLYTMIDYKVHNLIYFDDGTLYREYVDLDTDPTTLLMLIFETTIPQFTARTPVFKIYSVSVNYEVSQKENYLKQLARISKQTRFKFKVVGGN